jgi:hypothetical protein
LGRLLRSLGLPQGVLGKGEAGRILFVVDRTPEINAFVARWGDRMVRPLPPDAQLEREQEYGRALLATDPPAYQAGPLTTALSRVGQARRMLIPQAFNGFAPRA